MGKQVDGNKCSKISGKEYDKRSYGTDDISFGTHGKEVVSGPAKPMKVKLESDMYCSDKK